MCDEEKELTGFEAGQTVGAYAYTEYLEPRKKRKKKIKTGFAPPDGRPGENSGARARAEDS